MTMRFTRIRIMMIIITQFIMRFTRIRRPKNSPLLAPTQSTLSNVGDENDDDDHGNNHDYDGHDGDSTWYRKSLMSIIIIIMIIKKPCVCDHLP